MSLVSKRLPVLLAVLVGTAMALTMWSFMPNTVFAEGPEPVELESIELQNDGDLEWTQYFLLDGKDATISQEKLGVQVKDKNHEAVGEGVYDLNLQATWYSDSEGRDVYQDADLAKFGLVGDEASAGCTEYEITAIAKDGSGYSGEVSTRFYVVDKYSLSYICSMTIFENCVKKTNWRMRDWFWFRAGDDITPIVIAECGNAESPLTPGEDYTVTYYKQNGDMSAPASFEELVGDKIVDAEGHPAVPTEPGGYFMQIEGISPYYGENMSPVTIMDAGTIAFATEGDEFLWSNENKEYDVNVPEGIEGDVKIFAGVRGEKDWEILFKEGKEFKYDDGVLTLYGDNILESVGDDRTLNLYAVIEGSGEPAAEGFEDVQFRRAESNYRLPDDDEILPGWEGEINGIDLWVRDRQHWDGEDMQLSIKNAQILGGGDEFIELTEEDGWWRYRGKAFGSATIQVTYKDVDDADKTCKFDVNVADTVYHVDLWSEDNVYKGLPGSSITLFANAQKEWVWYEKDDPENPRYEGTSDNLTYTWALTEGADFAMIEQDKKEPYKAVLTFKAMPTGWDQIGELVKAQVTVCDGGSENPNAPCAQRDNDFWVEDDFYQISPTTINPDLPIGGNTTLKPELRHYQLGKDYSVMNDVAFELSDYDHEAIQVEESGGEFTITRFAQWDTNFRVEARWNGSEWIDQWYHLNGKNYKPEFGYGDVNVYDDAQVTLTPEIRDGEGLSDADYEITYRLGRFNWNEENQSYDVDYEIGKDSGVYKVDGKTITIFGDKLAALGKDNNLEELRVLAQLKVNGFECEDSDCWINLRESCATWGREHNWIKGVVKQPTLEEIGYEFWICPDYMFLSGCGECRILEIPKLIDIAGATVTVTNPVYTGKALKPDLVVKLGENTLKAGTDYTAVYTNNTKAGNAKVKLTGIGKYGGTKAQSFKIVKADNPTVVKTKEAIINFNALKKSDQKVKASKVFTITNKKGKVTYKKKSGKNFLTISTNGEIKVKRGQPKGKYYLVVDVTAAGASNYKNLTKAYKVTIRVK